MKRIIFVLGLLLIVFLVSCTAEKEHVTSKTLGTSDLSNYFSNTIPPTHCIGKTMRECKLIKILGIHQTDNSARVYYELSYDKIVQESATPETIRFSVNLVRFNSGKWYDTQRLQYVTKK